MTSQDYINHPNRKLWIQSDGSFHTPSKEERTPENAKKALAVALKYLDKQNIHDIHVLIKLKISYSKAKTDEIDQRIRSIMSGEVPLIKQYSIDWKALPFDKNLRKTCDVVFLIGKKKEPIPAHFSKLVHASEYFRPILSGTYSEKPRETAVRLRGVTPETFRNYLKVIYQGEYPKGKQKLRDLAIYADGVHESVALDAAKKTIVNPTIDEMVIEFKACAKRKCAALIKAWSDVLIYHFESLDLSLFNVDQLKVLFAHDDNPCTEFKLWEIVKDFVDPKPFIECIRFENMEQKDFIFSELLTAEQIKKFSQLIVARENPDLRKENFDYRPYRGAKVDVDVKGDKRCIATARIPLTPQMLKLKGERSEIKSSPEFVMFGKRWYFHVEESKKDGKPTFHGVYLFSTSRNQGRLKMQMRFGVGKNVYQCQGGYEFEEEAGCGKWFGLEGAGPPLKTLLSNNMLHVQYDCELVDR